MPDESPDEPRWLSILNIIAALKRPRDRWFQSVDETLELSRQLSRQAHPLTVKHTTTGTPRDAYRLLHWLQSSKVVKAEAK